MKKLGKAGQKYKAFRNDVAYPYLAKKFGKKCTHCSATDVPLDVDHIIKRGSHPELKYDLDNMQLLCRSCHHKKDNTVDGILNSRKDN